jgi:hypothetical protein
MFYWMEAKSEDGLRMGDIMAAIAEMQNRQSRGVDRVAGVEHADLTFLPTKAPTVEEDEDMCEMFNSLPDDVDVKVLVWQAWTAGEFPAFSLRRLDPPVGEVPKPSQGRDWKYELIVHDMAWRGLHYVWNKGLPNVHRQRPLYKDGTYEAKMLRVKDYTPGYLEACRNVYKLLPQDVGSK